MLRTTYKKLAPPEPTSNQKLPPGWTEHQAPTGHAYYYNTETKQSTYTRPTIPTAEFVSSNGQDAVAPGFSNPPPAQSFSTAAVGGNGFRGGRSYQNRPRRKDNDRPKSKFAIPNCEPWILVKTRLGRRFVHNHNTNESFWKFPEHVILAVAEMERTERETATANFSSKANESPSRSADSNNAPPKTAVEQPMESVPAKGQESDSDSYEEVEVTDDEGDEAGILVRQQEVLETNEEKPLEFDEDDIAYQLAEMGEDYGLDPEEYETGEVSRADHDGEDAAGLSELDAKALFYDLLDDHHVNPYTTWESVIENSQIIEDSRYTVLPNMRARKEAFAAWSRTRIQTLRERRAKEEKSDPRILYVRFLDEHATPKLYWPEFRRKYKNAIEMRDSKLLDKERERMYRDHIARLKLPEATRKSDLSKLLKERPLTELNRSTSLETLPSSILVDIRFISLPAKTRNPLVESHISTLEGPPESCDSIATMGEMDREKNALDRKKREEALAERERMVAENKRKQSRALRQGKDLMRENEMEIEDAMRVRKDGVLDYFQDGENGTET